MRHHIDDVMSNITIEDILKPVEGELFSGATDDCTYLYGNGELIISPDNEMEDEIVYVIDIYGDEKILVRT